MSDYRVAIGHDIAYASMTVFNPQPKGDFVAPVERKYGISGAHHDQGAFLKLHWDFLDDETAYQSLMNVIGILDSTTEEVTVYARNDSMYWRKYNATAHRPEPNVDMKWDNLFPRDINVYFTDLVQIAEP